MPYGQSKLGGWLQNLYWNKGTVDSAHYDRDNTAIKAETQGDSNQGNKGSASQGGKYNQN